MKINPLALTCAAVLCTILTLGLWPFHSPRNKVAWVGNHDGLRLGRPSTVVSSGPFQIATPQNNLGASLEIWLQPTRIWDFATLLAFYTPGNPFQFSLRQSQIDLLVRTETHDDHFSRMARLYVRNVFSRKPRPVFITITTGMQGVCIYIDGVLAVTDHRFPLAAADFTGRLVLGDSPGQTDSWSGQLLGFAIYQRQLTPEQVLCTYTTWKQNGHPEISDDERNLALYLFNEHAGNVVRNKAESGVDLVIPEKYLVLDQMFLEPLWTEFRRSQNFWGAALKNVIGFIPFGFFFYAYLATLLPTRRAALATIGLGTTVSVTIELLQAFLPTRDSGTADIITNTVGTWIGLASYHLLIPTLARFSPWPLPLPYRKSSRQAVWSATDLNGGSAPT